MPPRQIVAEFMSTFAVVLLSVNLVLSTRARLLERRLGGLDKLFVTHRTIGLSVALLVTAHFLLVPKSRGFVPSKPVGYVTLTLLLLAIFVASAPRFPWRRLVPLKYQTWKLTHRFMGVFLVLAATHSLLAHTYVRRVPLLMVYVYGVAAFGMAAWLYRELLFSRLGPFASCEIAQSRPVGSGVREITLMRAPVSLARLPGQFVFASFEDGPTREQHPFTISSGTNRPLRFSIEATGDFTRRLLGGVPQGSTVRVEGPYGAFTQCRGRVDQLWLAGGIGITPFLSMAADLDGVTNVLLVWSVRIESDAIYADELAGIAESHPNLRVVVHPTSELGHLSIGSLDLSAKPRDMSAFLCGPVAMRKQFIRQLRALGVPRSQIYFEEFRLR
jgi:predicted ferric reductase